MLNAVSRQRARSQVSLVAFRFFKKLWAVI